VYSSEAKLAGKGCYTLLLCGGCFFVFQINRELSPVFFACA
jgi:hypothetical protein